MTCRILLLATLGLSTVTALAADRSFDRTLTVSSAPDVSVSTGSGYVHLHAGSDTQIHISAHLHSDRDAESRMSEIVANPPIQQSGNIVSIGRQSDAELYRDIRIDYDIALPRASAITARTGSGEVDVQNAGTNVKAQTGSGNITAHGVSGLSTLQTGSGDIVMEGSGSPTSGENRLQTGSGSIRASGVSGGLRAQTGSGDVTLSGAQTADWHVDTGSGSVLLNLGSGAKYTLNAATGSGSVHVAQPIMVESSLNRHRMSGTVNGGGPMLRIMTGSGDVDIR
ncbi:MAG TPA: DUF4097 family beta strand repeat-containing protein [Granulicella sp.]